MDRTKQRFLYKNLAGEIEQKILDGTYKPGEKLPSIRKLHQQANLSISTVYQAFMELEATGLVEARSKSGYYVSPITLQALKVPQFKKTINPPQEVNLSSMINSVVSAINNPHLIPLATTVLDAELLPFKHFARILREISFRDLKAMMSYALSEGYPELRRQIAFRTLGVIDGIAPADIIITNGCMEAVALALLAIVQPGETVAIEAPTNFSFLQLLKELGVLVIEVPANPRYGVELEALEKVFQRNKIKACLFMPNFHNPLGAIMPSDRKKELIQLVTKYEVPIVEDDISSELYFGDQRPVPLKAFDQGDLVLTCSSFSKVLAPGLRIGWIIATQRYKGRIQNLKAATTVSTSTLDQYIIARFLAGRAYERHLRTLRGTLKKQMIKTALAIQKYFPSDTRLAVPGGGSLLWLQLHPAIDGLQVYQEALKRGISIIPGGVCSNTRQFQNYIQISFGSPFTPKLEKAIAALGELVYGFYEETKDKANKGR